jgi:hypothetical protein
MLTIPTTAEFHPLSYSPHTAYKRSRFRVCDDNGNKTYLFVSGRAFCVVSRDSLARSRKATSFLKSAFNFAPSNSMRAVCRVDPFESKCRHPSHAGGDGSFRPHFCTRDQAPHAGRLSLSALLNWRKRLLRLLGDFQRIRFSRTPLVFTRTASSVREREMGLLWRGFRNRLGREESRRP